MAEYQHCGQPISLDFSVAWVNQTSAAIPFL